MNTKLAIIDGDALTYTSSKETIEESIVIMNEKINNIFVKTEATHYVIFLSNTPYFRHKIDPLYKNARTKSPSTLKWLKTLKKYLIEAWNAQSMYLVEADDLCTYWINKDICITDDNTTFETRGTLESALYLCKSESLPKFSFTSIDKVLCAVDKDLLKNIPGKHFNYYYKLEDKTDVNSLIKGWWVETTTKEAHTNFWKSMITGDVSDGIKGLEGKGEKFFEKLIVPIKLSDNSILQQPYYQLILASYLEQYGFAQGIFNFQKNYRLLHMLDCDEDFMREVGGELPSFPIITPVTTLEEVKLTF